MTIKADVAGSHREPALLGQDVVVIGGSSGIGLATAVRARAEGAHVVLTGRDPERLRLAAEQVGARDYVAFDATDTGRVEAFFETQPRPVDHVMVTAGAPHYAPLAEMDLDAAVRHVADHVRLVLAVGRQAKSAVRPGGSLLFMGGTGARRPAVGLSVTAALTAALPALVANLALELAPVRVNLVAAGFVDTPLSVSLLGENYDRRLAELRAKLPTHRVVGASDVAALAVHLMTNEALTGATYDIDGGQQLL